MSVLGGILRIKTPLAKAEWRNERDIPDCDLRAYTT